MGDVRTAYKISVRKHREKKLCEGSSIDERIVLKLDPIEVGCECLDFIQVAQDRIWCWGFVNTVMNLQLP
jgi:hypothetical protein